MLDRFCVLAAQKVFSTYPIPFCKMFNFSYIRQIIKNNLIDSMCFLQEPQKTIGNIVFFMSVHVKKLTTSAKPKQT